MRKQEKSGKSEMQMKFHYRHVLYTRERDECFLMKGLEREEELITFVPCETRTSSNV